MVEDRPVHPMTRRTEGHVYGCHSKHGHVRKNAHWVKDGMVQVEYCVTAYKMIEVKDEMTRECQYCISPDGPADKMCDGCSHRRAP